MVRNAVSLFAFTSVLGGVGAFAANDESSVAELKRQVADLSNQVSQLKASQGENWLTEQRADEIRGLVHDVLADADTRASLLQGGMTGGWDKGFYLGSADGNYKLRVGGQVQVRWLLNWRDDTAFGDSTRWGFENRLTKIRFDGNVFDPSWEYLVLGAFERDGGSFVLDEAYVNKKFDNGMNMRFGQFKPGFLWEELVSSSRQLAVERSNLNEEFNQDRVQGLEFGWTGDQFRGTVSWHDGFFPGGVGTDNTGSLVEDTEWAFNGRIEWLAMGAWDQFKDFSSWKGEESALKIGLALHYQNDEYGTGTGSGFSFNDAEVENLGVTLDAAFETNGFNLYGAFIYRMLDADTGTDVDQWGFLLQGGYMFMEDFEGFARFEYGDFDVTGVEDLMVLTLGVNKYFDKHNLKWTTDVGYSFEDFDGVWATTSTGWLAHDDDGEVVLRSQFQLLF